MKCPNCGEDTTKEMKFCNSCDYKLKEAKSGNKKTKKVEEKGENLENVSKEIKNKIDETKCNLETKEKLKKGTNIANGIKDKGIAFWNKSNKYEKFSLVAIIISVLFFIIALLGGTGFAVFISIIQIILIIVSYLIKIEKLKFANEKIYKYLVLATILLVIPYFLLFSYSKEFEDGEKINWSEIKLNAVLPQPKSNLVEIIINDKDDLSIYVYKTSIKDFEKYIDSCKDKGFTIDVEEDEEIFEAYNKDGYKLFLYYYDNKMSIDIDEPMEFSKLNWPDNEYANLIPIPKSSIGKIEKNDKTGFKVYVAETTTDDFKRYVEDCILKGFIVEPSSSNEYYSAKNSDNYRVSIEYKGFNIIEIIMYEPEYNVDIEIDFVANWIFSKYDVDVYIDDIFKGTMTHGSDETYNLDLTKGKHNIRFENTDDNDVKGEINFEIEKSETIKYQISCYESEISVKTIKAPTKIEDDTFENEEPIKEDERVENIVIMLVLPEEYVGEDYKTVKSTMEDLGYTNIVVEKVSTTDSKNKDKVKSFSIKGGSYERGARFQKSDEVKIVYWNYKAPSVLTTENCEDLKNLIHYDSRKDKDKIKQFANQYDGKTIEIELLTAFVENYEDYKTRFNYLLYAVENEKVFMAGPPFMFENVNYYDLKLTGDNKPDTFGIGIQCKVKAKVDGYKDGFILLDPISIVVIKVH